MQLNEFYNIAKTFAPKTLSDEYCAKFGAYDNSGILLRTGEEIKGALFSLDFSLAAIEKAIGVGANVIVTHHPAIYGGVSAIDVDAVSPLGKKLALCLKNGISVISMHLNLDGATGGIDECLANGICLCAARAAGQTTAKMVCVPTIRDVLQTGGYGRVYNVPFVSTKALAKEMEKEFSTKRIQIYENTDKPITRVASFCGGGADEAAIEFAIKNNAQAVVSSDFKHHVLTLAAEAGVSVIALTHYASENYGFKKYYEKIRQKAGVPCVYHTDENML